MKTQRVANTPLEVSRIALGCMHLSGPPSQVVAAVSAALEAGINVFDHADIYGGGACEEAFSVVWSQFPGLRDRILLQSKCGIHFPGEPDPSAPKRYDFSYHHILASVDGSLKRLQTDYLDILLLHRPDALVEPEEVARAFDALQQSGKVRFFGVSNHTGPQIELLRRYLKQPLVVNQMQVSLTHVHLIDGGVVTNQDYPARPVRGEGTLEYCRLHDITLQAWTPLASGAVSRRAADPEDRRMARIAKVVMALANERRVSPEAILVAWLLRHPAHIQPIIGTTNPERIQGACAADGLELSREEWYTLFEAGRGASLP